MQKREFNRIGLDTIKECFEVEQTGVNQYEFNTFLGLVSVRFDPAPEKKSYIIFIQFLDEEFDTLLFSQHFGISDLNTDGMFMRLCCSEPDYLLMEFEDIINTLNQD